MQIIATKFGNPKVFNETNIIHKLHHFLPSQSPLKDFIHHNTLHAFQDTHFHEARAAATKIFGYKTSLNILEYRNLFESKRINGDILRRIIITQKGEENVEFWKDLLLNKPFDTKLTKRTGKLRSIWKSVYHFDMDSRVHPKLFRILNAFIDQGVSIWKFPITHFNLLESIRQMESSSYTSFFRMKSTRQLLLETDCDIKSLLDRIVGNELYYEQYILDQQFAHPGWSGMISVIEQNPDGLFDKRKVSLHDLISLELLFEFDALEHHFDMDWQPMAKKTPLEFYDVFEPQPETEADEAIALWQEAYEQTYYDEVLGAIKMSKAIEDSAKPKSFQAFFCIDDRECSIRTHLETADENCETLGTPGHFGLEFYFKPDKGRFYTKVCPAPVKPYRMIKEIAKHKSHTRDMHFSKRTHNLFGGYFIAQTIGFWSAIKLLINIFRPTYSAAAASSFKHMLKDSELTIECTDHNQKEEDLQLGFTIHEMANTVEAVLKSTGLVKNFAPIIYMIGHGSSSANNTYYAGYDCGACSGRPGSVNARVFSMMANDSRVRNMLKDRQIRIPDGTQFIGALHDTARDEIEFYDIKKLSQFNKVLHELNVNAFTNALDINAKERSRRFELVDSSLNIHKVHELVKRRTYSLFEPRPELNHATNTLCIIGSRSMTKNIFLDRRAFLNSYDYRIDPEGKYLSTILNAAAPVCGGINLEYFFSRVDNQKLGAGTKLPHNVMGLIGVANGIEGDLRTGLPSQMIEVHDPMRLLMVIEQFPDVVLQTAKSNPNTWQWIEKEWVRLAVVHPTNRSIYLLSKGEFYPYKPLNELYAKVSNLNRLFESSADNLPIYYLN